MRRANKRLKHELWKLFDAMLDEAERGDYRGGFEARGTFDDAARLRGVHFNNRLLRLPD